MTDVVDIKSALDQTAGNQALAKELFGMLLQELPTLAALLEQTIETPADPALLEHAHKLYGSTAYCGVPSLREAARRLELAVKSGERGSIKTAYQRARQEIERLCDEGPNWLARPWQ